MKKHQKQVIAKKIIKRSTDWPGLTRLEARVGVIFFSVEFRMLVFDGCLLALKVCGFASEFSLAGFLVYGFLCFVFQFVYGFLCLMVASWF
jgi:hypothetical protein